MFACKVAVYAQVSSCRPKAGLLTMTEMLGNVLGYVSLMGLQCANSNSY